MDKIDSGFLSYLRSYQTNASFFKSFYLYVICGNLLVNIVKLNNIFKTNQYLKKIQAFLSSTWKRDIFISDVEQ